MRKFAGIVESTIAPPTNCLWLCGHDAKYFSNGKWVSILSHENDADRKGLEEKVDSIDKAVVMNTLLGQLRAAGILIS